MEINRVFLIVLDSAGIGALPDAAAYGDAGSNTFRSLWRSGQLQVPHMAELGLFHIDGMDYAQPAPTPAPTGCFARLAEASKGKDTIIGHWEIAGVVSPRPLPTYPDGFPQELLAAYTQRTGRGVLCNKPYSGTQVIADYGPLQKETGDLIVYTSADSVFQVAANEDWIALEELYRCCAIAREMLTGEHGVGRVIARPYKGEFPDYVRTTNRHDYALPPPAPTMCDRLAEAGLDTIGVGKIHDIFAGSGIRQTVRTAGNADGMRQTEALLQKEFRGLAFINLVDFDMLYGHRNNVAGYTGAINEFDRWLGGFLPQLREGDMVMVTADHGCDPAAPGTDHTREYVPFLAGGPEVRAGINLGTRTTFADIAATVLELFGLAGGVAGTSMKAQMLRR